MNNLTVVAGLIGAIGGAVGWWLWVVELDIYDLATLTLSIVFGAVFVGGIVAVIQSQSGKTGR